MLEEEEEEEEGIPMTVAEKTSSGDMLEEEEEEEEGNPMTVPEKMSSGDMLEEEEEEDHMIVTEKKTSQDLSDPLDNKEGNAMTIDADSSVQLDARFEPQRSSRNPQMINKPSLDFVAWPKSPKVMKSKGKPTPRMVLLHVSVQIL